MRTSLALISLPSASARLRSMHHYPLLDLRSETAGPQRPGSEPERKGFVHCARIARSWYRHIGSAPVGRTWIVQW